MTEPDGRGTAMDCDSRRAVFESRDKALAFWREFPDWRVYHRNGGFDVPLVVDEHEPVTLPGPRLIVVVEWHQKEGGGGTIGFLSPSEEVARGLVWELGELRGPLDDTGLPGKRLFALDVCPLYDFEDVLHYLCNLAGPGGVLMNW